VFRTEKLEEIILERLRDGEALNAICVGPDMPRESTVRVWAAEDSPFADAYRRAREIGYMRMADEMIQIADTEPDAAKARNRIDVRKFMLMKMMPKIFGDRLEVENTGVTLQVVLTKEDFAL
jgi:hypothetical protein